MYIYFCVILLKKMLIIRLRRRHNIKLYSKHMYDLIVIKKGKAVQSQGHLYYLGSFNLKKNILLFDFLAFYK